MMTACNFRRSKHKKWSGPKNSKIKLSKEGLMLFFPSQNEKKNSPTGRMYSKNRPGWRQTNIFLSLALVKTRENTDQKKLRKTPPVLKQ